MKKISIFLMMLMAFCVPLAMNGQDNIVTIGDGTSTEYYCPVGTYYNYSITEQLYTAQEIGRAGTIQKISFYYAYTVAYDIPVTVYMKHVTAANLLTGISLADATEVYSGNLTVSASGGWATIELSTPFEYDGTQNLLIGVNKDYVYYTTFSSNNTWRYTAATNMARYTQNDSNAYTSSDVPGTATNYRPNIKIEFIPCLSPTNFAVVSGSETANSVDLSWTGENDSYIIEYADLSSATTTTSTTTEERTLLNEGFEGGSMPDTWTADEYWKVGAGSGNSSGTTSAGSGSKNAYCYRASYDGEYDLVTPSMDLSNATSATLTFKLYNSAWGSDINELQVRYRTNGGSWTTLKTYSSTVTPWTDQTVPLTGLGANYQISFYCINNYSYGTGIDDVKVTANVPVETEVTTYTWQTVNNITGNSYTLDDLDPETEYMAHIIGICGTTQTDPTADITFTTTAETGACPKPTNLHQVANTDAAHQVQFGWNQSGEVSQWQMVYSTDASFNPDNATPTSVSNNPYTLTGLAQSTTYYVYVRAYCDQDSQSDWSNMGTFTTLSGHQAPTVDYDASTLTAHTVTVTWTGVSTNVNHQSYDLYYSTSDTEPTQSQTSISGINATSQGLTGLAGETTYYVWVRDNCGADGYSDWAQTSFTTEIACPAPTGLTFTPTPLNGTVANMTWTETGSATDWVIEYGTNADFSGATPVNVSGTPSKQLTGLTAETTYYARVKADCGSVDGQSGWSNTCTFTPSEAVVIGNGTSGGGSAPIYGNYKSSYDQMIYTASQLAAVGIDGEGTITKIGFYSNSAPSTDYARMPVIYMCLSSKSSFSSNTDFVDFSEFTKVYDYNNHHTWSIGTGWQEFELDTPFDYDGESNLIIAMHCGLASGYSSTYFRYTTTTNNQVVYAYNDNTDPNPSTYNNNWSNYSGSKSTTTNLPNLKVYFEPAGSCAKPTNLTNGTPSKNSVQLSWTAKGEETQWQICLNGDESNLTLVSSNPYMLTGLTPATTYTAKVRAYCDASEQSNWSNEVTFTTDVACPAPNTLTVNNLTAHSAHVSWNGEAESYTVQYRTATVTGTTLSSVFEDGFENGLGSWTTYALDYSNTSTNWQQYNMTNLGSNGVYETNHSGSYSAMSRSYDGNLDRSVDNWLITPQMTLGDVVKFYMNTNEGFPDSYAVYVSTGSNTVTSSSSIGDFELVQNYVNAPLEWDEVSIDISAYAGQTGYVAIRHTTYGGDFICVDDFGVYNTINTYSYGTDQYAYPTTNSCQLTGLSPETFYEVMVQGDCGTDGTSNWSSPMYFTTPDNCGAPQELASSDITATSATLSWADDKDSYNLRYRKVYFYEGFEGGNMPTGWTVINANDDDLTWSIGYTTVHSGAYGAYDWSYVYQQSGISPDDYLVSPLLDLQGTLRVWLSGYGSNATEHYAILLSTTGNSASDFTTTLLEGNTTAQYAEVSCDLSSYEGQQGYIAIRHYSCTDQRHLYVDDFGLYGSENWVSLSPNPTTETAELTGLTPGIGYEWQVQGLNCNNDGDATDWSAVATFTTLAQYQKTIAAVDETEWAEGKGGYYLIASPLAAAVDPTTITDMIPSSGNYDLYSFDQEEENEWCNYKADPKPFTTLANGKGYLYANKAGVTLTFVGPAGTNGTVTLDKTNDNTVDFQGWNLVGNPFGEDAYITKACYTLENSDTYTVNPAGTAIHAMQGLLVEANSDGETLTFSTEAPAKKAAKLNMNVSKDRSVVDNAIISFNDDQQLPKIQFRQNSTKVYMPKEGIDYAIVSAESNVGEMPVNFKAEENGSYTLNFTTEEVSFAYLHLIDNMTGNDVDLLANPSYSFNAKTTDYESRFKLVFATGNNSNDDTFAFYSNGSFVINNEGNATLQVIDVNGRILKNESINGCANVNVKAAQGIYMLRLVNGENVKVQKMVVR